MATRFLHLQGIGKLPAKLARQLKVGDILSWNWSFEAYEVVGIEDVSPRFLLIREKNIKTGEVFERRMMKDKLVAARTPQEQQ